LTELRKEKDAGPFQNPVSRREVWTFNTIIKKILVLSSHLSCHRFCLFVVVVFCFSLVRLGR